ncbi:MAG: hypothetical protein V4582_04875 [Pseudomonadota bacterium]
MSITKVLLANAAVFVVVVMGAFVCWRVPHWEEASCVDSGGKWLVMSARCETVACADSKSCLSSYDNTGVCERLRVGATERQLKFMLGQAIRSDGLTLFFRGSATEPSRVKVVLDNQHRAKAFECRSALGNGKS